MVLVYANVTLPIHPMLPFPAMSTLLFVMSASLSCPGTNSSVPVLYIPHTWVNMQSLLFSFWFISRCMTDSSPVHILTPFLTQIHSLGWVFGALSSSPISCEISFLNQCRVLVGRSSRRIDQCNWVSLEVGRYVLRPWPRCSMSW